MKLSPFHLNNDFRKMAVIFILFQIHSAVTFGDFFFKITVDLFPVITGGILGKGGSMDAVKLPRAMIQYGGATHAAMPRLDKCENFEF